jgi:hypothetical protein
MEKLREILQTQEETISSLKSEIDQLKRSQLA